MTAIRPPARHPVRPLLPWLLGLALALGALAMAALAETSVPFFSIQRTQADLRDSELRIDADLRYRLTATAREAVASGIPLTIEWRLRLVEDRAWLWDLVTTEIVQGFRLTYFSLGDRYLVHRQHDGVTLTYVHLDDALAAIGRVRDLNLGQVPGLSGDSHYGEFRGELIIEELPTPVRLWAYVSPEWRLVSDWLPWSLGLPANGD